MFCLFGKNDFLFDVKVVRMLLRGGEDVKLSNTDCDCQTQAGPIISLNLC